MSDRREWLGSAVDAVMDYWRSGIDDDELAADKWWVSDEAADAALEIVHAVKQAIEESGFVISDTDLVHMHAAYRECEARLRAANALSTESEAERRRLEVKVAAAKERARIAMRADLRMLKERDEWKAVAERLHPNPQRLIDEARAAAGIGDDPT